MTSLDKKQKIEVVLQRLKELFPHATTALEYSTTWELLVAVILSAQCTDKLVSKVTANVFKKYPRFDDYLSINITDFEQDIHSVNFYRNKAKNILATAKIIQEQFHGHVPDTMEALISLPGVARKTANVILSTAFHKYEGIAVDTHVKRLSQLLGLTTYDDPVKIEKDLIAITPQNEWGNISYLLIDYGRKYCPARPHDHKECPLHDLY